MTRSTALIVAIIALTLLRCSESYVLNSSGCLRKPSGRSEDRAPSTRVSLFRRKKAIEAPDADDRFQPHQNDDPDEVPKNGDKRSNHQLKNSRRSFLSVTSTAASASLLPVQRTFAAPDKRTNISDSELKQIILSDIVENSFLVTAEITRSVYDESAIFTDEIDVYTMDKWIKGTKALFIPSGSRVSLVGDIEVSKTEVSFRFDEDLMFNIPFKPVCSLSGKVVLTRDVNSGLITSYREYWDQSVNDVLKSAKFGKKA